MKKSELVDRIFDLYQELRDSYDNLDEKEKVTVNEQELKFPGFDDKHEIEALKAAEKLWDLWGGNIFEGKAKTVLRTKGRQIPKYEAMLKKRKAYGYTDYGQRTADQINELLHVKY